MPADDRAVLLRASHFGQDGMLRLVGSRLAELAVTPLPSFFWAAGFSFSRSQLIQEVIAPQDFTCKASHGPIRIYLTSLHSEMKYPAPH